MFHKESISGLHDFKQKSGHRTNSWSDWVKNLPKKWPKIPIISPWIEVSQKHLFMVGNFYRSHSMHYQDL